MNVKIKKLHPNAVLPTYAHDGDAAMDVTAISVELTDQYIEYDTGLSFELPKDYVMLIFPRSSNSKKDLLMCNSVGVLDAIYRGSLKLRFKRAYRIENLGTHKTQESSVFEHNYQPKDILVANEIYKPGERIGQIMILPRPKINFIEVDELTATERGDGGFGSTNK